MGHIRLVIFLGALIAFVFPALQHGPQANAFRLKLPGSTAPQGWVTGHHHSIRLLDGGPGETPRTRWVGVEIKLDKNWKTYWSNPGDSGGVPPLFSSKGSRNVEAINVALPAPVRIRDRFGLAIGYKDRVVFPIQVVAKDANQPVDLKLYGQYGVCLEICIPAEAYLTLSLPTLFKSAPAVGRRLVSRARSQVPMAKMDGTQGPKLLGVTPVLDAPKPLLRVKVRFTGSQGRNDLFTEVSGGIYVAMAQPVDIKPTDKGGVIKTFEIDLTKGDKIQHLFGKTVRFVMTGAERALVESWQFPTS